MRPLNCAWTFELDVHLVKHAKNKNSRYTVASVLVYANEPCASDPHATSAAISLCFYEKSLCDLSTEGHTRRQKWPFIWDSRTQHKTQKRKVVQHFTTCLVTKWQTTLTKIKFSPLSQEGA